MFTKLLNITFDHLSLDCLDFIHYQMRYWAAGVNVSSISDGFETIMEVPKEGARMDEGITPRLLEIFDFARKNDAAHILVTWGDFEIDGLPKHNWDETNLCLKYPPGCENPPNLKKRVESLKLMLSEAEELLEKGDGWLRGTEMRWKILSMIEDACEIWKGNSAHPTNKKAIIEYCEMVHKISQSRVNLKSIEIGVVTEVVFESASGKNLLTAHLSNKHQDLKDALERLWFNDDEYEANGDAEVLLKEILATHLTGEEH